MGGDKVFNLGHPLGWHTVDILAQRDLVNVSVRNVPGWIIVAADNRGVHAVAFGDIKDRFLQEVFCSAIPDVRVKSIWLTPDRGWRIGCAPGGIRADGNLVVVDGRPAILRPRLTGQDAVLSQLMGGR